MNREHVLFHLQGAEEELTQTIKEMREDPGYYHHLDSAWNGRDASLEQATEVTDELFKLW